MALGGDVMLGRGVDQILPRPGDPALREAYVRDARTYVRLAEAAHGPIPRPVGFRRPWGEALRVLEEAAPDARIVNLETAITRGGTFAPGKAVHYRMSPGNLPCLAAGRPDVCVLANNHVMDFGVQGLVETLAALEGAGLAWAGAGRDEREARRPAAVPAGSGRVLVFAFGMASSGIPAGWAAGPGRPGVAFVPEPSQDWARAITERVRRDKRAGDVVVASVHWGSNWGHHVPGEHVRFAHALVDGGVDVVHGHSSHHPRPIEVYRGRLVLYGCGDLIDDYEGITGYEEYRDDLRPLYLASLTPGTGALAELRIAVLRARRMRLERAAPADAGWLADTLRRVGTPVVAEGGTLVLRP
ncbi:CapA family protein [Actinomadura kijaniata]|uniref:Poly-gamma-glutamate synthesis protein (Capsule biosynthesis protein) n=1 Tax=Actinomadura namibiensis TaxID=182080 RepID=A0A7W3QM44_ACTNM|nr:CapA family protein [Actinomadura namibiensis]MBA8952182.1 poly-gamma-glutamate synthesis protein (capsule biosynthesis protein) [Actinomadura namibiensis]